MNKNAPLKKSGTPLLAALLLVWSTTQAAGEIWPQPESAYNSSKPRPQWLDTTPDNRLPQPVSPQQLAQQVQPQYPAVPAPTPYAAPAYGGYGGYPAYGYAPRGYAPPAYGYGYGYGYAPRRRSNSWWPGNGSWPNMNNWSMPSPSFSTPSFSMPSNPFGW